MAIGAGADAIGLVGRMPSGPGVIDDAAIRKIAASVPPAVGTFLLTSEVTAKEIVRMTDRPIFLAGGINPGNVRKAIESVHPYGIDVRTGVRSDGFLDNRKLTELFKNIRG
ncbi:MAG: hypothetical protein M1395_03270 [Bacteroidetes bacterium]|jgi:phosphoribosylanthranilate isomerase|nr:hypothetical protein [Bacteroidota bacterium]